MNKTSNSDFNNSPQVTDISGILSSLRDFPSVQTLPHARHISAIVRLWKGTPMFTLSSIFSFNPAKKRPQSNANDLRTPQSSGLLKFAKHFDIPIIKANRSDLAEFSHPTNLDVSDSHLGTAANISNTKDIQEKPEIPVYVIDPKSTTSCPSPTLECAASSESTTFPLEWLLDPDKPRTLLNRVLGHLVLAEAKEINPHFRDDIRIAWLTCKWAFDGVYKPQVAATYRVLGIHPNLVWSHVLADRHAKLADEFPDWFDGDGNRKPDVPKKPVTSIPASGGICIPAGVGAEKMACPVVAAPSVPSPKKKESA